MDWDALRERIETLLAKPRFEWTQQRRRILYFRAQELTTGKPVFLDDVSAEWSKRQLAKMWAYVGVKSDDELVAFAYSQGIIPKGADDAE